MLDLAGLRRRPERVGRVVVAAQLAVGGDGAGPALPRARARSASAGTGPSASTAHGGGSLGGCAAELGGALVGGVGERGRGSRCHSGLSTRGIQSAQDVADRVEPARVPSVMRRVEHVR